MLGRKVNIAFKHPLILENNPYDVFNNARCDVISHAYINIPERN